MARSGFYDLNIRVERGQANHMTTLMSTLHMAYQLGYDTVAINTVLEEEESEGSQPGAVKQKKGAKTARFQIPDPISVDVSKIVGSQGRPFRILNRLTVCISSMENAAKLTFPQTKKYDLLAVQPVDAKTFQASCCTLDVDIICLPLTKKLPMFPKIAQVTMARERGIFFEISYVPSFSESFARRYTIANAQVLLDVCRRKNMFLSSEALQPLHLRAPYDVMNISKIFGFNPEEAKALITACSRSILTKSEARRFGKGLFKAQQVPSLSEDELWKINRCKIGKIVSITKLDDKLGDEKIDKVSSDVTSTKTKRKLKDTDESKEAKKLKSNI